MQDSWTLLQQGMESQRFGSQGYTRSTACTVMYGVLWLVVSRYHRYQGQCLQTDSKPDGKLFHPILPSLGNISTDFSFQTSEEKFLTIFLAHHALLRAILWFQPNLLTRHPLPVMGAMLSYAAKDGQVVQVG